MEIIFQTKPAIDKVTKIEKASLIPSFSSSFIA